MRKNHWANGCTYKCAMCPDLEFPEVKVSFFLTCGAFITRTFCPYLLRPVSSFVGRYFSPTTPCSIVHPQSVCLFVYWFVKISLKDGSFTSYAPIGALDSIAISSQECSSFISTFCTHLNWVSKILSILLCLTGLSLFCTIVSIVYDYLYCVGLSLLSRIISIELDYLYCPFS